MTPEEKPAFESALRALFAGKGRRTDGETWPDSVTAYWTALAKYPLNAVRAAVRLAAESDEPLPIAGKLRVMAAGIMASDDTSDRGCSECAVSEIPGMVKRSGWSAVYQAEIDRWHNCSCAYGRKREESDRQRHFARSAE